MLLANMTFAVTLLCSRVQLYFAFSSFILFFPYRFEYVL